MILAKLAAVDLDATGDISFTLPAASKIAVTGVLVTGISGSVHPALGTVGVYTQPSAGGTRLTAAGEIFMSQIAPKGSGAYGLNNSPANGSLTSAGGDTLYLNRSNANGGALVADIYIVGDILDA